MSTSSIKRQIRRFHVVVVQWTSKKCTKKRDARAELLFWSLNLLFFEVVVVTVTKAPYWEQRSTKMFAPLLPIESQGHTVA